MADTAPWEDFGGSGIVPTNTAPLHTQPKAGDVKVVAVPPSRDAPDGPWNDFGANTPHAPAPAAKPEAPMKTTPAGALWRGIQDGVPFIDYFTAMNDKNYADPNTPYAERVRLAQEYRAKAEAADKSNGGFTAAAHYGGELGGLLAGGEALGALGKVGRYETLAARTAATRAAPVATLGARALQGAGMGAVYGAGSGTSDKIVQNAVVGAGTGAVVGAVAPPLVNNFLVRPLAAAADRVGLTGAVAGANRGVNALLRRSPQDADEVAARAAEYRAAGIDPSVLDVMDQGGRDTVNATNVKVPVAREQATEYDRGVQARLPGAIDEQVTNNVTPNRLSSSDLRNMVERSQKARNDANYRVLDPMHIPLDADAHADIRTMLRSPGGTKALDMVASGTNADTAAEVSRLRDWAHAPEPEQGAGGEGDVPLPPGMEHFSESALGRFRAQHGIPDGAPSSAYYEAMGMSVPEGAPGQGPIPDPSVTYATVDKVRKAANGLGRRAQGNDPTLGLPGDYFALGNRIDSHLSDNTGDLHDVAKATHGAYAHILDAIDGSGKPVGAEADLGVNASKVNGADFVDNGTGQRSQGNYQNFAPWARNLSREQHPMSNADGTPMRGPPTKADPEGAPLTMSAHDAARVSAANQVRAQSQRPASALATARNFAANQGQDAKSAALLGSRAGTRLRTGGGLIAQQAENARKLAGRSVSDTAKLTADSEGVADAMHGIGAVASIAHGSPAGIGAGLRAFGGMLRRSKLNPEDAQAMVESAIDNRPGAVDDFIANLRQRGINEVRARQLWGVARRAAVASGAQQATAPSGE